MEEKEYKFGSAKMARRKKMGPPGMGGGEKAKDFAGTWKKLIVYCRKFLPVMIIAVACAAVGTVFTLIGPDKLSHITDEITAGISPNTDKLQEISETITDNVSENMKELASAVAANLAGGTGASDLEFNGVTFSAQEQADLLNIMQSPDMSDTDNSAEALETLPDSVKNAVFTDVVIDNVTITGAEQLEMVEALSGIDENDTDASLAALDSLPESVYGLVKPCIDLDAIVSTAVFLLIIYALSYILSVIQGWIMATVTQKVSRRMRSDISRKINVLPMAFYNRTTTGDILSRVTNDVDTIGQSLNQSIGTLVTASVQFFGSLIIMFLTNAIMAITAVAASIIGFAIMFLIMGRSQKYFNRQQQHLGELNGHIEEMYAGHTVVKAYNGEQTALKDFDRMNENLRDSAFKAQCLAGMMMPFMNFIGNLGYVAVCVVGAALAMNGQITFGVIVAFMMYVRYFTSPLQQFAQAVQSLQSAAAAGERVLEFLAEEEMEEENGKITKPENIKGDVEFEHVRFGYEGTDITVIHDFSAHARPGQKIAIVGPTGAGKTTLVNLLMRFHEVQSGEVRIDGIPIRDMTREAVHDQFCMVLQDTWLFEGTVRENLVYCTEGVSDEKIKTACKAVGLDHFIRTLPKGYDTVLNDMVNLSQGQRQQITIARAMIADKPMLILDEATSSVDTRTEVKIQAAMDALMENRTSFVIAHRLSTIKNADIILVLKDGDIVESGSHEELLKLGGFYADLYNSQFEDAS